MFINYDLSTISDPSPTANQALPKGRYFTFLNEADTLVSTKNLYIANRKTGKLLFSEIKGSIDQNWRFPLSSTQHTFWMVFQFLGTSSIATIAHSTLAAQQYHGFFGDNDDIQYVLETGKMWMILIGMQLENTEHLDQEWQTLASGLNGDFHLLPTVKIAFRNKKILNQIQRIKDSPFSLVYKLQYQVVQLMETYHGDLREYIKSIQPEDISLFHHAKEYIIAHYMEEGINIRQMAQELLTSERTLYRIFKENGLTVNRAIQAIRIYKGRELLRETNTSVDMIAFHLQFSTAKYFIKQYVKYFGHTPATERKLHPPPVEPDFDGEDTDEGDTL